MNLDLILIMGFGALVALAGVVLLFRKNEKGTNKIKLLGQEFEMSTPAVVVFLAGAAIFVMPFFVGMPDLTKESNSRDSGNMTTSTDDSHIEKKKKPNHKKTAAAKEKEPNDGFKNATEAKIGETMQGQIKNYQDSDYFFVNMVDDYKQLDILLENHSMELYPMLEIYDSSRQLITAPKLGMTAGQDIHHAFSAAPGEKYYVHVGANAGGKHSNYSLHFEVK